MHKISTPVAIDERAKLGVRSGDTVRVHQKIVEYKKGKGADKKEKITATARIQIFEGLVIGVHRGHSPSDHNFTVRRIASGVGVERIFPLHSSMIEKIEVKKVAKIRRAKLNFLRGRSNKSARISERFTSADEFAVATAPAPVAEILAASEAPAEAAK